MNAANLTVYRQLDPSLTTDQFKAYITEFEQSDPNFVDAELARDYIWTDEIVGSTIGFAVVDRQGKKLASFKTLNDAEAAKASAKVVFDVRLGSVEDDD